jgi:hypothetical protein
MTDKEHQALAMLRAGMSYEEAARNAGLPVEHAMELWRAAEENRKAKPCQTP